MAFTPFLCRWQQALFFVGTISVLLFSFLHAVRDAAKHVLARLAAAFGSKHLSDSFSLNQKTDTESHSLVKRAGTVNYENAWANGVCKLQKIQHGNPNPPMVVQEVFDDLGWTIADDFDRETPKELAYIHGRETEDLSETKKAFTALKLDPFARQYLNTYDPNYSERKIPMPTKEELREHVPEFNRWSDVVWFLWAKSAAGDAKNLRYIVRDSVTNFNTKGIVDPITGSETNAFYPPWPGKTFELSKPPLDCGKIENGGRPGKSATWNHAWSRYCLDDSGSQ
ncbi:MAG: hypothetical protein Q9184_000014 [Pyrenodesmia sp. 2 TL-2023]